MNILPAIPPEAQRSARKSRSGNYFTVHLPTVTALIDRGMSHDDLIAYFVLAAGTDVSNTATRSGRQAIATALNCSRHAAAQAVTRLVTIGAIVSLEDELVNLRDPTATRFRLLLVGDVSIVDVDVDCVVTAPCVARLPNSLIQDKAQAASLCRAVRVGGMPVLTTLLNIASDPAQNIWPPALYADVEMETIGRLGSKTLARFDIMFGLADTSQLHFAEAKGALLLLAESAILCFDLYAAIRAEDGGLTKIDPVATIWRGSIALNGPLGKTATLALLAARISQDPGIPLPERGVLLAEFRQADHVIALLPATIPNVRVIMRPRLATLPQDPETVDAERRLNSAGMAAAQDILAVIAQIFPDMAAYAKALIKGQN